MNPIIVTSKVYRVEHQGNVLGEIHEGANGKFVIKTLCSVPDYAPGLYIMQSSDSVLVVDSYAEAWDILKSWLHKYDVSSIETIDLLDKLQKFQDSTKDSQ